MKITRIVWGIVWRLPFLVGMILLNLLLSGVGFLVIPLGLLSWAINHSARSEYYPTMIARWKWKWLNTLWGNEEDGIDGLSLLLPSGNVKNLNWNSSVNKWPYWKIAFVWSAWRNSVNNLRFTRLGSSPAYVGNTTVDFSSGFLYFASGPKCFIQVPLWSDKFLWLGWKPGQYTGFKSTITSDAKMGA